MRAFRLENGISQERLIKASLAEVEAYARQNGGLTDAVLVIQVQSCYDAPMENGAEPQRKAQPR